MKHIKWKILAGVVVTVLLWWVFMSFVTHLGLSGYGLALAACLSLSFILRIAVAVGEEIGRTEAAGDIRAWSEERRAAGLGTIARGQP
ncbi:MAG: hypothetical protein CTY28_14515 [Hyphomicrobium sp.]|nr:MAG: hypothetical protein CTY28_14515 [Hyphomicrobium sp.]